jgi:hypothetical protein
MSPEMTEHQLLQETHDAVIELSAVVLGVKGQGGLIQQLQEVKLAVTSMTLKVNDGDLSVSKLLGDVIEMKPKVDEVHDEVFSPQNGLIARMDKVESCVNVFQPRLKSIDDELHNPDTGTITRVNELDTRGRNNRSLIVWFSGVLIAMFSAIIGFLIYHIDKT